MKTEAIKNIRKEYLVVMALVLIIGSAVIFNKAITRTWYEMTVDQECVKERYNEMSQNYIPGEIVVSFKENIDEYQAGLFANQYGISVKRFTSIGISTYYVPEGSELNWLCILKNDERIEYTTLNGRTTTANG